MTRPHFLHSRSDSQSTLLNSRTNPQGISAGPGQQNDQPPRMRSVSTVHTDAFTPASSENVTYSAPADHREAEQLQAARDDSRAISEAIKSLTSASELETDQLLALFGLIKGAQKNNSFELLRRESTAMLISLGTRIASLLSRLSSEIESGKFDVSPLNADDIHQVCNALAAVVGDGPGQSIFLKQDLKRLHAPLQVITGAMLGHALDKKFPEKHWDNTQLLNVLNWLSRGLKQYVLSEKNANVRQCFASALKFMQSWAPSVEESTGPETQIARLDSRQLSKCLVQINTCIRFSLVDLDSRRSSLASLILGLCGGRALNECTLWDSAKPGVSQNRETQKTLRTIVPRSALVTGVSNTIKDALAAGILDLSNAKVQAVIGKVCRLMQKIPASELLFRGGQGLSNCCNFLREIYEVQRSDSTYRLTNAELVEATCQHFLGLIPQSGHSGSGADFSEQSTANLFSFVKAMQRTHVHDPRAIKFAAVFLLQFFDALEKPLISVDSIGAMLGGLQHFAQCHVIDPNKARNEMSSLIGVLNDEMISRWPERHRATLMRALVFCSTELPKGSPLAVGRQMADLMQTLLKLSQPISDRLPYLQAISILVRAYEQPLDQYQSILPSLLPAKKYSSFSLQVIEVEIQQLSDRELPTSVLPAPVADSDLTTAGMEPPAMMEKAAVAPALAYERRIVGMTKLIEPPMQQVLFNKSSTKASYFAQVVSTTTTTTTTTTTKTLNRISAESWQTSARGAKVSDPMENSTLLTASPPAIQVRGLTINPGLMPARAAIRSKAKAEPRSDSQSIGNRTVKPEKMPAAPDARANNASKANKKKAAAKLVSSGKSHQSATPVRELFDLLKQDAPLSDEQAHRISRLLNENPSLATNKDGTGKAARSALFYAITNTKWEAIALLAMAPVQDAKMNAETLKAVFDEILVVEDMHIRALSAWMTMISPDNMSMLKKHLAEIYPAGDMQKRIAIRFFKVLDVYQITDSSAYGQSAIDMPLPVDRFTAEEGEFKIRVIRKQAEKDDEHLSRSFSSHENDDSVRLGGTTDLFTPVDKHGRNALMLAVENNSTSMVNKLCSTQKASSLSLAGDKFDRNALMYASVHGNGDIVSKLLELTSADLQATAVDVYRANALLLAADAGQVEMVNRLLDLKSAKEQATNCDIHGKNALFYAVIKGNLAVIDRLLALENASEQALATDSASKANVLLLALGEGHVEVAEKLLKLDSANVQALNLDTYSTNALMVAACNGYVSTIKTLLGLTAAFIQANTVDYRGRNALMHAARMGQTEVVDLLLAQPYAANLLAVKDDDGETALTLAKLTGHSVVVNRIVQFQSSVNSSVKRW